MNIRSLARLNIPSSSGVYIFRDSRKRPLYIGRATSLRDRVRSYFSPDTISLRGPRIVDMTVKARSVSWDVTDSVLEAIILESSLIKKYQPFYNIDERDDRSSIYIVITDEEWPRVFTVRARDFEHGEAMGTLPYNVKRSFGPYPHSGLIHGALKILRSMFPFKDKKSHDPRHEAFYRSLGKSPDPGSIKEQDARASYEKTIDRLILFFEGKKKELRKQLTRDMNTYARTMKFEEANKAKKLLYALDHIDDVALIKRERDHRLTRQFRMEAFDVAHMGGKNVVGVMVVTIGGERVPSEYRKFKLHKDTNNDIANLIEITSRRLNHTEWSYPDLIVVDGNNVHRQAVEVVLKARRIPIPVVAVTKDEHHKASNLAGDERIIAMYRNDIIALNAEAHRFAIRYHRSRRSIL